MRKAPQVADGGDRKDPHRQAAELTPRGILTRRSAEEIAAEGVPGSRRRERIHVFTPPPETFLFSVSEPYAYWLIQNGKATVLRTSKRFRGIVIIPEPSIPAVGEKARPQLLNTGRRVLGYAHKERSEFCPAGVWTLDRLPQWAQTAFLQVAAQNGAKLSSSMPSSPRGRGKVIEMPKRNWRDRLADKMVA
jgi:hypothetical protein